MQGQYDRLLGEIDDAKRDAQAKVYKSFSDDAPVLGGASGPDRGLSAEGGTGHGGGGARGRMPSPGNKSSPKK